MADIKCDCSLRMRLVGDGCEKCNQEYAESMSERRIPCPECKGSGRSPHAVEINGEPSTCSMCKTGGTVHDRRAATVNDRAVKRIKAVMIFRGALSHGPRCDCDDCIVLGIINEEASYEMD